jgi:hypothetical protein
MQHLLLITLLALPAIASAGTPDPDTFIPEQRNPAWLTPIVRQRKEERTALAAKYTPDFLKRCAKFHLLRNREFSREGERVFARRHPVEDLQKEYQEQQARSLKGSGLKEDEVQICEEIKGHYFEPRNALFGRVFERALVGSFERRKDDWELKRMAMALDTFRREFGTEVIANLDTQAEPFWKAFVALSSDGAGEPIPSTPAVPGQDTIDWAQSSALAFLRRVASDQTIDRYLAFQQARKKEHAGYHEQWISPGAKMLVKGPDLSKRENVDPNPWEKAAIAAGLTPMETRTLRRLLELHSQHARRRSLLVRNRPKKDDATSRYYEQREAGWIRYRQAIGEERAVALDKVATKFNPMQPL